VNTSTLAFFCAPHCATATSNCAPSACTPLCLRLVSPVSQPLLIALQMMLLQAPHVACCAGPLWPFFAHHIVPPQQAIAQHSTLPQTSPHLALHPSCHVVSWHWLCNHMGDTPSSHCVNALTTRRFSLWWRKQRESAQLLFCCSVGSMSAHTTCACKLCVHNWRCSH